MEPKTVLISPFPLPAHKEARGCVLRFAPKPKHCLPAKSPDTNYVYIVYPKISAVNYVTVTGELIRSQL